jgi:uncharacterized protein YndB with AHSA1/START domain
MTTHDSFTIERTYPASHQRVFSAFANQETKLRWFAEGEGWEVDEFTVDFREGGRELARFQFKGGAPIRNDTVYLDIVPDQRIVFAYTMTVGEKHVSASLATVEFASAGDGTRLTFTEQAAFFDGADGRSRREGGWGTLFRRLGEELGSQRR